MELIASFDRHSRRRSLAKVARVTPAIAPEGSLIAFGLSFLRSLGFGERVFLILVRADGAREYER